MQYQVFIHKVVFKATIYNPQQKNSPVLNFIQKLELKPSVWTRAYFQRKDYAKSFRRFRQGSYVPANSFTTINAINYLPILRERHFIETALYIVVSMYDWCGNQIPLDNSAEGRISTESKVQNIADSPTSKYCQKCRMITNYLLYVTHFMSDHSKSR